MTTVSDHEAAEVKGGVAPLPHDRRCPAAFCRRALGAEIAGAMPPDASGRTLHVHLYINGGSVMMSDPWPEPLARQFRGERYGQLRDPFGVRWSLASHA